MRHPTLLLLGLAFAGSTLAATPPWQAQGYLSAAPPLAREVPAIDAAKLLAEDLDGEKRGQPRRIGLVAGVDDIALDLPSKSSSWRDLGDGRLRWQALLRAPGARGIDVAFSEFRLPAGAELWLRRPDGAQWYGPYSDADNPPDGRLFTPLLDGDSVLIELTLPAERRAFARLRVDSVTRAYRAVLPDQVEKEARAKSGSCNIDVACADGNPWRDQINSVAHYTFRRGSSTFVCTGQLVATTNAAADSATPTFLTAQHCVSTQAEVSSMVLFWKYESPSCRAPGSGASGVPLNKPANTAATQTGATLLASHAPTDFTVIRLTGPVPAAAQPYWSGWDRREAGPTGAVTIHHPAGDEKRISFNDDPLTITPSCIRDGTPSNTHWEVDNWELGTTEGGSSGAGLWRPDNKLLIGVLSGGLASCSRIDYDCYGRLAIGWEGGGAASSRVRDWLDPQGSGIQSLAGRSAAAALTVSLESAAFTTPPEAGSTVSFSANVSGASGSLSYEWDLNGDGAFERRTTGNSVSLSYPTALSAQVAVRVTAGGSSGIASRALDVRGPQIAASSAGAPSQICGNGDGNLDPGERWNLPVRLQNTGSGGLAAGHALFAATAGASAQLDLGPNAFGYAGTGSAGACPYSLIDIASGPNAVPALETGVFNGNDFGPRDDARTVQPIALGGQGIEVYGQRYSTAVMSTNGYLSFSNQESGGQWNNTCTGSLSSGAVGPQLRVLHDDLVVREAAGAGLRYRYFASCPRAAQTEGQQGCHVFQWSRMAQWNGGDAAGDFSFQAVVYEQSGQIVYQYIGADPLSGGSATIGLVDVGGSDPLNLACEQSGSVAAGRAYCAYSPNARPKAGAGLRLPQAAAALPALGAGQSTTVNVPVQIPADAACGSALGLDYVASADSQRHSVGLNQVFSGAVAANCSAVTSCPVNSAVGSARRGLYFNEGRPGNGLNSYFYDLGAGAQFYGGLWYTALADSSSAWYLVSGELADFAGELALTRVRNAAAPSGFSTQSDTVGRAWIGQLDNDSLLLAWRFNDGRSGAERMDATAGLPFASQNHTQAWFNPAEDGWGVAIESLNLGSSDFEFFAGYIFDANGAPRWVIGDKGNAGSGAVSLFDYKVHCPACPWYTDSQNAPAAAGSLNIQYSARNRATLSTGITLPAPLSGSWTRSQVPIQPIADPSP